MTNGGFQFGVPLLGSVQVCFRDSQLSVNVKNGRADVFLVDISFFFSYLFRICVPWVDDLEFFMSKRYKPVPVRMKFVDHETKVVGEPGVSVSENNSEYTRKIISLC